MKPIILVLAHNNAQYRDFLRAHKLTRRNTSRILRPCDLGGQTIAHVLLLPDWKQCLRNYTERCELLERLHQPHFTLHDVTEEQVLSGTFPLDTLKP